MLKLMDKKIFTILTHFFMNKFLHAENTFNVSLCGKADL